MVDILKKLSEVLDDTDAPVITGINNGDITNKVVSIAINDINEVSIILNGQIVSKSELENINEDGIYELKVIDKAFNETSIIFTIDMKNPIIIGIENNAYYNKEVVINSNEEVEVYLEKDGIKVDNYKIGDTIKEDGIYKVYVEDKAGNVSETITFTIDTIKPTAIITYSTKALTNGFVVAKLEKASETMNMFLWIMENLYLKLKI